VLALTLCILSSGCDSRSAPAYNNRGIAYSEQGEFEKAIAAALAIAEFLEADPRVSRVLYPGLPSFEGHQLAKQQMHGGFGAMLSFELAGDFEKANRVTASTKLFQLAVSLGAVESLIEQPASMSHASYDRDDRLAHGIKDELIRLSVGLEDPTDLIADLDQALNG